MTPHAITAIDGPAELIMIFDRDGQRAHVHHETAGDRGARSPARARHDDHHDDPWARERGRA
jgi:hypothetical protein